MSVKDLLFFVTNFPDKVSLNPQIDATLNTVIDTAYVICRKCRQNYPREFFANSALNSTFATCIACRTRDHARRFPTVFEPAGSQRPIENNGKTLDYWITGLLMRLFE